MAAPAAAAAAAAASCLDTWEEISPLLADEAVVWSVVALMDLLPEIRGVPLRGSDDDKTRAGTAGPSAACALLLLLGRPTAAAAEKGPAPNPDAEDEPSAVVSAVRCPAALDDGPVATPLMEAAIPDADADDPLTAAAPSAGCPAVLDDGPVATPLMRPMRSFRPAPPLCPDEIPPLLPSSVSPSSSGRWTWFWSAAREALLACHRGGAGGVGLGGSAVDVGGLG